MVAEYGTRDIVLNINNLYKSYIKGKLVNDNISLALGTGEIFGLLGPNGAGKTTLVSQIIGLAKPDSGSITIDGVDIIAKPGYARQACSFQAQTQVPINGLTAVQAIELVGRVRGGDTKTVRTRAKELLHNLEMEEWTTKPAETFSGGMRRLVAFCMAAVMPGRIVILDEPTNDIDINTLRALEEGLENFAGCAVVISHDRWFLDRIATHILAFEGDSQVYFFEGGYSDYEENRKKRLGNESPTNKLGGIRHFPFFAKRG